MRAMCRPRRAIAEALQAVALIASQPGTIGGMSLRTSSSSRGARVDVSPEWGYDSDVSNPDGAPSIESELSRLVTIIERLADTVETELARRKQDEDRQAEDSTKTRSALNALILVLLAVGIAAPFLWWNDFNRLAQQYTALIPIALAVVAVLSNLAYRAFQANIVDLEYVLLGALLITAALAEPLFASGGRSARQAAVVLAFIALWIVYIWHEAGAAQWERFKELVATVRAILTRPVVALPMAVLVVWDLSPSTLGSGLRPWLILLGAFALGVAGSAIIRIGQRPPKRSPTSPGEEAKWGPVVDELIELATEHLGRRAGKVKRLLLATALSRSEVEEAIKKVSHLSPYFGGDAYPNLALAMRRVFDRVDHQSQAATPASRRRGRPATGATRE